MHLTILSNNKLRDLLVFTSLNIRNRRIALKASKLLAPPPVMMKFSIISTIEIVTITKSRMLNYSEN